MLVRIAVSRLLSALGDEGDPRAPLAVDVEEKIDRAVLVDRPVQARVASFVHGFLGEPHTGRWHHTHNAMSRLLIFEQARAERFVRVLPFAEFGLLEENLALLVVMTIFAADLRPVALFDRFYCQPWKRLPNG